MRRWIGPGLLLVTEEEEIRALFGTEQSSATVRGAIVAEVSKANWTLLQALLFVADFANTAFHKRLSFRARWKSRASPKPPFLDFFARTLLIYRI